MNFSAPSSLCRVLMSLVVLPAFQVPVSPVRAESPVVVAGSTTNEAEKTAAHEDRDRVPSFRDGDGICFMGDSITAGGWYQGYLDLFSSTRFPDRNIEYWNCGIGGDTATALVEEKAFRIQRDILDHRPTTATVMLGMNCYHIAPAPGQAGSRLCEVVHAHVEPWDKVMPSKTK